MRRRSPVASARLAPVVLAVLVAACGRAAPEPEPEEAPSALRSIRGTVIETARPAARVLVEDEDGRMWSVAVGGVPALVLPDGQRVAAVDLLPGMPLEAWGEARGDTFRADSLRVPAVPPVLLVQPREGLALTRPVLSVEGYALRGQPVRYRVLDGDAVLEEGLLEVEPVGVRRHGAFRADLPLAPHGRPEQGLALEVWIEGDEDAAVRRTLRVARGRTLVLYYPSRAVDPQRVRCGTVYPLTRSADVFATPEEVVRLLLGGLAPEHERRGFVSPLTAFADVRAVTFRGETAVVELPAPSRPLDRCEAQAAEAQLRHTLREAFGVRFVRVLADGQPLAED